MVARAVDWSSVRSDCHVATASDVVTLGHIETTGAAITSRRTGAPPGVHPGRPASNRHGRVRRGIATGGPHRSFRHS